MNDAELLMNKSSRDGNENCEGMLFSIAKYYIASLMILFLDYLDNNPITTNAVDLLTINDDDDDSCIFDSVLNEIEQIKKRTSTLGDFEFKNSIYLIFFMLSYIGFLKDMDDFNVDQNTNANLNMFLDVNVQRIEEVTSKSGADINISVIDLPANYDIHKNESRMEQKKRKNIDGEYAEHKFSNESNLVFSSPPSSRLRSRTRADGVKGDRIVSNKKKNVGRKK